MIKPFIINSNMCLSEADIRSFDRFMNSCAGNIGNMYITYALLKQLGINIGECEHIQNIYSFDFERMEELLAGKCDCTHIILVLQDQIRISESYNYKLNYKGIIDLIDYINKPLLVIGIGANSLTGYIKDFYKCLDKELIWFLKALSERCSEIGVRGEYTQSVFEDLNIYNTCVIGCPSYYEMGDNRIVYKRELRDVTEVLFSSNFMDDNDEERRKCDEIVQDRLAERTVRLIAFDEVEKGLRSEQISKYFNRQYHIFSSIEEWKQFVSKYGCVLGYRLHGAILSLNAGVPSICCNPDSRAREMCEYLHIPYLPQLRWTNFEEFKRIFEGVDYSIMNTVYPQLFNTYCDFLYRNVGITKKKIVSNIANITVKQPSLVLYKMYDDIRCKLINQ